MFDTHEHACYKHTQGDMNMDRPSLAPAYYTGDAWAWTQISAIVSDFWRSSSLAEIHMQTVNLDSRLGQTDCGEILRKIVSAYGSPVRMNVLGSEYFYVQAGDQLHVTVYNANHRSRMTQRINEYRMEIRGAPDVIAQVAQQIRTLMDTEQLVKVGWYYSGSHGVESTNLHIQGNRHPILNQFYPWLPEGVDAFIHSYMKSDSSVLVLYGPPGTGKTSFLRHLLVSTRTNAMITYDEKVIENDGFFVDYLTDDEHDVMIVEDADVLLAPREDGANHIMSKFLNVSDGLIRINNKKMVFTTNINQLNKIDPALLRPGRCFAAVNFRELSPSEAAHAAEAAGLPARDWHSQDQWSLAQLWGDQSTAMPAPERKFRVGFV